MRLGGEWQNAVLRRRLEHNFAAVQGERRRGLRRVLSRGHRRRFRHGVFRRLIGLGRQFLGEPAVAVSHPNLHTVGERCDTHPLGVDVRTVRAGEIVQDEEPALEDDLRVVAGDLRIAEDDVVAGIASDSERAVGLQPVAALCPVQADEEQFRH